VHGIPSSRSRPSQNLSIFADGIRRSATMVRKHSRPKNSERERMSATLPNWMTRPTTHRGYCSMSPGWSARSQNSLPRRRTRSDSDSRGAPASRGCQEISMRYPSAVASLRSVASSNRVQPLSYRDAVATDVPAKQAKRERGILRAFLMRRRSSESPAQLINLSYMISLPRSSFPHDPDPYQPVSGQYLRPDPRELEPVLLGSVKTNCQPVCMTWAKWRRSSSLYEI
jgi:hypothetical protein